jgi:hypothetical protein
MVRRLGDIDFGVPDANAEYVIATKANSDPIFLRAYVPPPLSDLPGFRQGSRFLLLGLKGTGKTAVLRNLEQAAKDSNRIVEFLIFRNEILEEKDLLEFNWPILIDDQEIKRTKHYLHCVKRILLAVILKHCTKKSIDTDAFDDDDAGFFKDFWTRIKTSPAARLVQISFDTVNAALGALNIDIGKITSGRATLAASRLLKRQNDILLENACRLLKANKISVSIFIDEIHFAYRDEETLRQDAMLVRDTILAVINLNERFITEKIDCTIYAGFRSEFLDHPLIAAAEINNALASYGETLSWATFPADAHHPMFDIAARRVEQSIGRSFPASKMLDSYFGAFDPQLFVESTWSKPRDIIRFFNIAKKMYPDRISMLRKEFNAVLREYCSESWFEIKTAATAFLPPAGIVKLEEVLRKIGPKSFEPHFRMTFADFASELDHVYAEIGKQTAAAYTKSHLLQLLFILGLYSTRHVDSGGQSIVYSYHRGNRHPSEEGYVFLHRAVARAFS